MKIVFLITLSDPIGGAQIHVRDLSQALMSRGHQVTVLVGNEGLFTAELKRIGITYRLIPNLIRPVSPLRDWRAIWEIRSAVKELRPDLLTTHSSKAGWLGRIAGRSLGIPTFFTAHGWAFTEGVPRLQRKIYRLAENFAAPLAARIITVSDFDRNLALKQGVGDPEKLVAVLNGVLDVPRDLWAKPGIDPPRLIMVARFGLQKDHSTLFRALERIRELEWEVDLVGDGPLRSQAEKAVREIGLGERIHFLGERQDVSELMSRSQAFLLVTNWEGFPLSILEAMRAKLPVIASDVGGVREAVADGVTGYLVPRGDDKTLAERLSLLLRDNKLRVQMGEAGRSRFESSFTVRHMVERTLAVYDEVVDKPVH